jgi:hypothetical protein
MKSNTIWRHNSLAEHTGYYEFMETGNPKMRLRCFAFCELLDMNRRICA